MSITLWRSAFALLLVLGAVWGVQVLADEPSPQVRPKSSATAPLESKTPALRELRRAGPLPAPQPTRRAPRDPFAPPPALRGRSLPAAARTLPLTSQDPLADLQIRALIVLSNGRSGAIVSTAGRRWLVRKDDRLPLGGLSAQVLKVDRQGLQLQLLDSQGVPQGAARTVRQ